MNLHENELMPPARLAVAYAPRAVREGFEVLLRLDSRFAAIVGNASEPLFAQIRLAWWRDAMLADPAERPKGEPLLATLFGLDEPIMVEAAVALANAWELLVVEQVWSASTVREFACARGTAVFDTYAKLVGKAAFPSELGQSWAVNDLRTRFGSRVPLQSLNLDISASSRIFRSLTILAISVSNISGPRVIWHALTGR